MGEFMTATGGQALTINALTVWVCWYLGYGTDTYLPWSLVLLQWTSNWITWNAGVFRGALGFHRLKGLQRQQAEALFNSLDTNNKDTGS